jgi:hypothetical protein
MPKTSTITLTVLISIILATTAFLTVAKTQSASQTQPAQSINVTEAQAIEILKESDKTDPRIINGIPGGSASPASADLEYISLNWTNYLKTVNSDPLTMHDRIYVSPRPVGEVRPYWLIDYETSLGFNYGGSGRYVVDAQTGELMLSLESTGGGVTAAGPDYLMSLHPNAWDPSTPIRVKPGESTSVVLRVIARPYYNASLPVSLNVTSVPMGFNVTANTTSTILKTGGSASFLLKIYAPISYPADFLSPQNASQIPHFDMEIGFLGTNQLNYIYVEPTVNATVTNQTVQDLGNASQPQRFIVEGGKSLNGTRIHNYRVLLNEGDAVGFEFNSTQQLGFSVYYIAQGQPPYTWYSENTTHMRSGLIALRSGVYDFAFTVDSPKANATFSTWRISWDPSDVFFKESGGSSGAFGGMGWGTSYLEPTPRNFVVGRTWYNSTWTDHSISFEATLSEGTVIEFGYNSTEPVIFGFASDSGTVLSYNNLYSYKSSYTVRSTGKYTFSFDVAQPETAIVAFRCRTVNGSSLTYPDQTAAMIEDKQLDEVKQAYPFPPTINRTITITGKLGASQSPTGKGRVMTLKLENSTKSLLLHLGSPSEFIPVTTDGSTMLGNVTLTDLNNAYVGNSTIRVTGFPFQISLNGVIVDLFHVNSAEIVGPYPLYAKQSSDIVSGYNNQGLENDTIEFFPVRFKLGFNNYTANGESYYGNVERFYSSYVKMGPTIKISYNATKPVEFGLYTFTYNPDVSVVTDFELAKPSDYIIRESGLQSYEQLFNVPRSGFYTFAFKASGGVKSSVVLDVSMIK